MRKATRARASNPLGELHYCKYVVMHQFICFIVITITSLERTITKDLIASLFEEIDVLRENMSGFNSKASEVSLELARFSLKGETEHDLQYVYGINSNHGYH